MHLLQSAIIQCVKSALVIVFTVGFNAFSIPALNAADTGLKQTQHKNFIIIAHRGGSGYLPEHTKEAAVLAFMQGADYIEQDLVLSKDKHLIVLHDIYLDAVTNVESVFPERARKDKRFYVIDFTLEELRRLSVHERENNKQEKVYKHRYEGNSHFTISTFEEHVELIRELNRQFNKNVGWYPEIKAPAFHKNEGKDISKVLANSIKSLDLNHPEAKLFVQSFEPQSLKDMRFIHDIKVPLVQLMGANSWNVSNANYKRMLSRKGLKEVAKYATAIAPWLPQVFNSESKEVTQLVNHAHSEGLLVHPYTHREDSSNGAIAPKKRFMLLKQAGINGIFTDQIMPYMH